MDYEVEQPELAPRDPKWHLEYAITFLEFSKRLEGLQNQVAMQDAEDLGDYVETIGTLLTFRPHTMTEIERDAYEVVYGKEAADMLRDTDKALRDRA